MCGIVGYTGSDLHGQMQRMINIIRQRGPDGHGDWTDESGRIHFGHTLLSIIDRANGNQPLVSHDGTIAVTYNGEIYNYDEVRNAIRAAKGDIRTRCDTELMPQGFAVFGTKLFERLNGMFAFALYDSRSRSTYLVRDHLGIKPLYYSHVGNEIVFASSPSAVIEDPRVDRSMSMASIRDFIQFRYVTSDQSMYKGVHSLPPGCYAELDASGNFNVHRYWSPNIDNGSYRSSSEAQIIDEARSIIEDSVKQQLRSDQPVGLFLSGGIDSATVAHFASKFSNAPLRTFTYATPGISDETSQAKAISENYNFKHNIISSDGAEDVLSYPDIVSAMDNPVGDLIVVPTYRLCAAAAGSGIKVALTGEGADELFGGYNHFPILQKIGALSEAFPLLRFLAPFVRHLPVSFLNAQFGYHASIGRLGRESAARLISYIGDPSRAHRTANSMIDDQLLQNATTLSQAEIQQTPDLSAKGLVRDSSTTWLPNQIMSKMDQLSMAVGLEARVPLADWRLLNLMLRAPDHLFWSKNQDKIVLRRVGQDAGIPANPKKVAFLIDANSDNIKHVLDLCSEWLSPQIVKKYGIFRIEYINEMRRALESGEFLALKRLTLFIALHAWLSKRNCSL